MGRYTALTDPAIDRMIQAHLDQVVDAITARTAPRAIILYGSVARGEASVMVEDGQLTMLSDYEISVVGRSPRLRRLCADLSRQMTARLGVDTGINWMRPSRLWTNQTKNLAFGQAAPSIFMYELKAAGRVIYGEDLLRTCPPIRPQEIPVASGLTMVLNRMAEALAYLPWAATSEPPSRLAVTMWINKVVLACADALLLSVGRYHYSYRERGRRFAAAHDALAPVLARVPHAPALVERAVEFKLRPRLDLYPDDLDAVWGQTASLADAAFRHLVKQAHGETFEAYATYPDDHLAALARRWRQRPLHRRLVGLARQKLVEGLKYVDRRRLPPPLYRSAYSPAQVVYTLVPVLFQAGFQAEREAMLSAARRWLAQLGPLPPSAADWRDEWNRLREPLVWNWRVFCY